MPKAKNGVTHRLHETKKWNVNKDYKAKECAPKEKRIPVEQSFELVELKDVNNDLDDTKESKAEQIVGHWRHSRTTGTRTLFITRYVRQNGKSIFAVRAQDEKEPKGSINDYRPLIKTEQRPIPKFNDI